MQKNGIPYAKHVDKNVFLFLFFILNSSISEISINVINNIVASTNANMNIMKLITPVMHNTKSETNKDIKDKLNGIINLTISCLIGETGIVFIIFTALFSIFK